MRPLPSLTLARVDGTDLGPVLEVDHRSFPWLWRNSAEEFAGYIAAPGVEVLIGRADGAAVGYAGFTINRNWGHLDRLGVVEGAQGRGWGAALLAEALTRMAARGVTRVTLSTQETNVQSQRLYRGFGFRRTSDFHLIYGRWLGEPRGM